MALACGENKFQGRLLDEMDARTPVAAYELAEERAIAAIKRLVRAFVAAQECPSTSERGCARRTYDSDSLQISVRKVWGEPSTRFAGHYRVLVEASYSFTIVCEGTEQPLPAPPAAGPGVPLTPEGLLPDVPITAYIEYILSIACQHFCLFKEAGSDLLYTHVHVTVPFDAFPAPPDRASGVGHDDRTNPDNPHHSTVSRGEDCRFETKPDGTTVFPSDLGLLVAITVYFTACGEDGSCPDGFTRYDCPCGCMCFTFFHSVWERWYQKLKKK